MLDIDGDEDDEADESEEEAGGDEGKSPAGIVGGEGEDEQHDGTGDVGCNSIKVGFDGVVTKSVDDLREEELNTLERDAETNLNGDDDPAGWVFEDLETLFKIEFLVDLRGAVYSHSFIRESLFFFVQKSCFRCGPREVPIGNEGENDGAATFN